MRVSILHACVASLQLAAAAVVTIDKTPKQTLTSFGASGAWWPNDLINFPTSVQQDLGRLLFSSDGLYLSSYRYNMGADGGNDTRVVNNGGRLVQSFLLRNGTYDYTRDRAGTTFMKMAAQYNVPEITFFVNAAPSNISTNGAACGWDMPREKVPQFVDYIVKVLAYWTGQGIGIKWISPMNEPDVSRSDCGQEGMFVGITKRPYVFSTLRAALDNNSISNTATAVRNISIMGDETSQVTTETFLEYPLWLPAAKTSLNGISVHNYDFPDDLSLGLYRTLLNLEVGPNGPPVKFTETCCSTRTGSGIPVFGSQYDPTMQNALIVARYIWQFLTIVQATSFDWWLAVSFLPCSPALDGSSCDPTALAPTSGFNDGLIYVDPRYGQSRDYTLHLTKRAYMLKHFSYFHRPGAVRYDVPQTQLPGYVNAVASLSADNGTWNVLFMNAGNQTFDLRLTTPSVRATVSRIVVTTNQDDWREEGSLPVVNGSVVAYTLPALSLVTLQFSL